MKNTTNCDSRGGLGSGRDGSRYSESSRSGVGVNMRLRRRPPLPFAFTEHGAFMGANILDSPRAFAMSVYVILGCTATSSPLCPLLRDGGEGNHILNDGNELPPPECSFKIAALR